MKHTSCSRSLEGQNLALSPHTDKPSRAYERVLPLRGLQAFMFSTLSQGKISRESAYSSNSNSNSYEKGQHCNVRADAYAAIISVPLTLPS